ARRHGCAEPAVEAYAHRARGGLRIEPTDDAAAAGAREEVLHRAVRRHEHPRPGHPDARHDPAALVRRAAGGRERGGKGECCDERSEERPHTTLRNQRPENTAPASMKTSPPAAAAEVTSTVFLR